MTEKEVNVISQQELNGLLDHQKQLKEWLNEVNQRIYELEASYLEETPTGNIVRGWDIDSKSTPMRPKQIEEKERIFSGSSYQNWIENKSLAETETEKKANHPRTELPNQLPKSKKSRKSSSQAAKKEIYDDDKDEDYF
jgi:hypothetical protein